MTSPPPVLPLSVFIIALNEADRVAHTIESVRSLSDDIVVIDSGSTDGTQEICAAHGAKVLFHAWPGYGLQKRYGEEQCRHDWLLNLDADEVATPELIAEIRALFAEGTPAKQGYMLTMAEILPGEAAPTRFSKVTRAVRLYDRRAGRYSESPVHDRVQFSSGVAIASLRGLVWHRSSRSLAHSMEKINRYSTMQAEDMLKRNRVPALLTARLMFELPLAFVKAYFRRGYVLKGMPGFVNSVLYAYSRFLRLAKLDELLRRRGLKK